MKDLPLSWTGCKMLDLGHLLSSEWLPYLTRQFHCNCSFLFFKKNAFQKWLHSSLPSLAFERSFLGQPLWIEKECILSWLLENQYISLYCWCWKGPRVFYWEIGWEKTETKVCSSWCIYTSLLFVIVNLRNSKIILDYFKECHILLCSIFMNE